MKHQEGTNGLIILTNPEKILSKLTQDLVSVNRELLIILLNAILKVESSGQLHAEQYARTEERTDYRNGFR